MSDPESPIGDLQHEGKGQPVSAEEEAASPPKEPNTNNTMKEKEKEESTEGTEQSDCLNQVEGLSKPKQSSSDDHITEEEEKKLLADDEEDLDVIDCYTDDFESDMEGDFCRKEECKQASKEKIVGVAGPPSMAPPPVVQVINTEADDNKKPTEVIPTIEEKLGDNEPKPDTPADSEKDVHLKVSEQNVTIDQITPSAEVSTPSMGAEVLIEDDDTIQIDDDNVEMLLDEMVNREEQVVQPEIMLRVKDEMETERILSEPLIKQMIIPEINISDEEDDGKDGMGSQESLSLQIDHYVCKAAELVVGGSSTPDLSNRVMDREAEEAEQAGPGLKIGIDCSGETSDCGMYGCQPEDPDVLQLKLDLYQDMGEINYEPDEEEHRAPGKDHKTDDDEEKLERRGRIRVKDEPITPVKWRLKELKCDIPTIELSSSDDDVPLKVVALDKNEARKSSKKNKKKKDTDKEGVVEWKLDSPEDTMQVVESTVSDRAMNLFKINDTDAGSAASFDETLLSIGYSDRVMSLRKRKVTILPEVALVTSTKKIKKRMMSVDSEAPRVKKKKKVDPAMTGYSSKRRKSVSKSASKSSVVSVSTATSSLLEEELLSIDPIDETLVLSTTDILADLIKVDNVEKSGKPEPPKDPLCETSKEPEKPVDELSVTMELKNAIVKELETEISFADSSMKGGSEEQIENGLAIPPPTTDIALADMLESFFARDEEQQTQPSLTFHSISSEEKFLMDSLFADCDKQAPGQGPLTSLSTIMDDGKPLVEKQDAVSNDDRIVINYTILEGCKPLHLVPFPPEDQMILADSSNQHDSNKIKRPHINIIQNYQRYPFQPKVPKKRIIKQTKVTDQLHRSKPGRKRPDSDEEYRPSKSCSRPRKFPSKTRKSTDTAPHRFRSKGEYLSADAMTDDPPVQNGGELYSTESISSQDTLNGPIKHMPSLEEDLALTSSDSSASVSPKKSVTTDSKDHSKETVGTASKSSLSDREETNAKKPVKVQRIADDKVSTKGKVEVEAAAACLKLTLPIRKRGRPKLKASASHNLTTAAKAPPNGRNDGTSFRKRGRRPKQQESKICDFFCSSSGHNKGSCIASCCQGESQKSLTTQPSQSESSKVGEIMVAKKIAKKRKKKRISSSSDEEMIPFRDNSTTTISDHELELSLVATPIPSEEEPLVENHELEITMNKLDQPAAASDIKLDNLQVIISPLTDEKIRKINTPKKKPRVLAKASQTEICGLTWSVDLDQIDFHSEYFQKLRSLLNGGSARKTAKQIMKKPSIASSLRERFNDVEIISRIARSSPSPPPPIPPPDPAIRQAAGDNNPRSRVEELLFQQDREEEIQLTAENAEDRVARSRLDQAVKSVRSNFRIPKITKQASTSPQAVSSSTSNAVDLNTKQDEHRSATVQLPSSSRCILDRTETSHRSFEKIDERPPPTYSSGLSRSVAREYVNDGAEGYKLSSNGSGDLRDRDEVRLRIMLQERFETPADRNSSSGRTSPMKFANVLNTSYSSSIKEKDPRINGATEQNVNAIPQRSVSLTEEIRTEMLDRSRIKRTIRNDISQQPQSTLSSLPAAPLQQPLPMPLSLIPDDLKYNQQLLAGLLPYGESRSYAGAFNQGYPNYSEPGLYSGGGMLGAMLPSGGSNEIGALVSMLLGQLKQQQHQQQQQQQHQQQQHQQQLQLLSASLMSQQHHQIGQPVLMSQQHQQIGQTPVSLMSQQHQQIGQAPASLLSQQLQQIGQAPASLLSQQHQQQIGQAQASLMSQQHQQIGQAPASLILQQRQQIGQASASLISNQHQQTSKAPASAIPQQHQQISQAPSAVVQPVVNRAGASQPFVTGDPFAQNTISAAANQAEGPHSNDAEMISFMFGCYDFLNNKCLKTMCRFAHYLSKEEDVDQKLSGSNRDIIMATYRFVASRDDLFVKYFPVYAGVMGRNSMRHQLVDTIADCEQSRRPIQYYRYIVEGLKMSGLNPVQAVQIIIDKHTKKNFHQINVIVELIIDTGEGILTFMRWLENILHVKEYSFDVPVINRLLEFAVVFERLPNELAKFLSKLVLKVTVGQECQVNMNMLLEFVTKLRLDPEMSLDVSEIVSKYGKVEIIH